MCLMNEPQSTLLDLVQVENPTVDQSSEYKGMLQLCGACKKTISLAPGDLIYGGQWYHLACYRLVEHAPDDDMTTQDRLLKEHRAQLKF